MRLLLTTAHIVAFVVTANPERARAFYEGVLGLSLVADEPFALVFDANGVTLRVAKVPRWRSPAGARVAWFKDPDGNVLSLSQSSA